MKSKNVIPFLWILLFVLGVFLFNMTFAGLISSGALLMTRVLLILFFFTGIIFFRVRKEKASQRISMILMIVNLSFLVVSFFNAEFWNLNLHAARGIALAKLSDSFFVSLVLIGSFFVAGIKLKEIYLARGRFVVGLLIGLLSFFLMGYLAFKNPDQPLTSEFLLKNLAWILIFIFSNAFMEELLFRGIFLKHLAGFMKPIWAIVLTSVVFAAAHLQVNYASDILFFSAIVLVLGFLWGLLMHYTKSIIASVLFHAGADLMIIIPLYTSFGANG